MLTSQKIRLCAAISVVLAAACSAQSVAIVGTYFTPELPDFLTAQGISFQYPGVPAPGSLATHQVAFLLRINGNLDLENWVRGGGTLITEWSASDWALNTANLLPATESGGNCIGQGIPVTFTPAGAPLAVGVNNPYSDGDRTHCFRNFTAIMPGADILATRPTNEPCILGGQSGSGYTLLLGYDWMDHFVNANADTQQLILNAINFSSPLDIDTVNSATVVVAPGQNGVSLNFDVENTGSNTITINSVDLSFLDSMANDVTSEYTVTPAPGNPTSIAAGATENFTVTADVSVMATFGTITVDANVEGTDQVTMATHRDDAANTPHNWDVVGSVPFVRTIDAVDAVVVRGATARVVTATVENVGFNAITVNSVDLRFTGTVDRTADYTVTPDPANPTSLAGGATETFTFGVDVDAMAALETVTIDATFDGQDAVSAMAVSDPDADVTDSWLVEDCLATLCGDCTGDGMVTILDALISAQHAAGLVTLTGSLFSNCNVIGPLEPDPAAAIGILDALTIAQSAAGLPVTLTCC